MIRDLYSHNRTNIDLSDYLAINEFEAFIDFTQNNSRKNGNLEAYLVAAQLFEIIEKKVAQFNVS